MKLFRLNLLCSLIALATSLSLTSCDTDPEEIADIDVITYPVEVNDVTSSSAFLNAHIQYGAAERFSYLYSGIIYSTFDECPEVDYEHDDEFMNFHEGLILESADGAGYIEVEIPCLPNTTYFYRAFVCYNWGNSVRYAYGDVCYFRTPDFPKNVYPVDLGLSVLWGDANLGAENIEYMGQHFAWGEIYPNSIFDWNTYKFGLEYDLTKYNNDPLKGYVDNKYLLDPEDDATSYHLGNGWCIPTAAEWQELIEKCDWYWTTYEGIYGYRVYGRGFYHNSSIFLPAEGYYRNGICGPFENDDYSTGMYWSSTTASDTGYPEQAYHLQMCSPEHTWPCLFVAQEDRAYGLLIRPVKIIR